MLFLARFSGIWEIFSSFIVLSFTSSEVDELEKSTCSVKLGIALFVCLFVCFHDRIKCKQTLSRGKCWWLAVMSAFYILSSNMVANHIEHTIIIIIYICVCVCNLYHIPQTSFHSLHITCIN